MIALLTLAAAVGPQPLAHEARPFRVADSQRAYSRLQDAVRAIGNGRGTIVIAPGRYRQCAVQERGEIAFVASRPGSVIFDGGICEGKAALVLRGRAARVEGIVFTNMRVPDSNGAGIRIQQGDLVVRDSQFRDSENGILSHDDPRSTILIERSTFSGLGLCAPDINCAHSIYVNGYGALIVRRSRFERGRGGHYVKSRAARIEITDCSFDDSAGRATNYMIDLSNGAAGLIARNLFVQGRDKENDSTMIAVAPEGARNRSAGLVIAGNEAALAPGASATAFVADFAGEPVAIGDNRLARGIARYRRR